MTLSDAQKYIDTQGHTTPLLEREGLGVGLVYIQDSVVLYRGKTARDTVYREVTVRDSVEVPVEVVRVERERYVPWWYRYPAWAMWGILLMGVAWVIARVARLKV